MHESPKLAEAASHGVPIAGPGGKNTGTPKN